MSDSFDSLLRREAMSWLTVRTNDGADSVRSDELDFEFQGGPFRLMDAQAGIWKPKRLSAALSIRTAYTPEGKIRPYDDSERPDGLINYKWRGEDPNFHQNRALRAAMEGKLPLIWFFGVGVATYKPIFPVYLLWEEPEQHQFVLDPDATGGLLTIGSVVEERMRKYITRQVRQRLHQPVFRATVLRAYETRCAVCALGHSQLLDAAHIVPDREEAGIASIRNGLALCKIHHAAYDAHILGISPDLVVNIRSDLLLEQDGPMLKYGLQERHGQKLMALPRARIEQPDRDLLDYSFKRFLAG